MYFPSKLTFQPGRWSLGKHHQSDIDPVNAVVLTEPVNSRDGWQPLPNRVTSELPVTRPES